MKYLLAALVFVSCASAYAAPVVPTVLLGARANQDGQASLTNPVGSESDVLGLETAIGRKIVIDNQYSNWADFSTVIPPAQAAWDIAGSRIPMISWKTSYPGHSPGCATWSAIVTGAYDAQLIDQAAAIQALGGTVMIRWHYEMEHPQGGDCFYDVDVNADPVTAGAEYVAAWQHVVDLFRAHSVTNVQWVWAPGADAFSDKFGNPDVLWQDFYPGDPYVDWIGVDVYNKSWTAVLPILTYAPFVNFYNQTVGTGKPLMLSETGAIGPDPQMDSNGVGCAGSDGGLTLSPQRKWISSAADKFKTQFSAIKGYVYWSSSGTRDGTCSNYILRGDGLTAFTNMGAATYFQATHFP